MNQDEEHTKRDRLQGLDPSEYEHPFDKELLDKLEAIPGLPYLSKKYFELGYEKTNRIKFEGSYLKVDNSNLEKIYSTYLEACSVLDFQEIPTLYIKQDYQINAAATGVENPMIFITTGCLDRLRESELMFILGHELGHIKSGHVLYRAMSQNFTGIADVIGDMTFGIGDLLATGVEVTLKHWARMSELTSDRAGYLACQNKEGVMGCLMKMAGFPTNYESGNLYDSFIKQAKEFDTREYMELDGFYRIQLTLDRSHPWTVLRASEILEWEESGQYKDVLRRKEGIKKVSIDSDDQYCANCGYKLKAEHQYCGGCGARIND